MTVRKYVLTELSTQITRTEEALKRLREDKEALDNRSRLNRFNVALVSSWEDSGEQNVEKETTGTLAEAIAAAEAEFLRINNRPDVQATYTVSVVLPSGTHQSLPETHWAEYRMSRK